MKKKSNTHLPIIDRKNLTNITPSQKSLISGSLSEEFTESLQNSVLLSTPGLDLKNLDAIEARQRITVATLKGISPQDEIEGMLAAQMITAHNATMDAFTCVAVASSHSELKNTFINQATKLSKTYAVLTDTLLKYRYRDKVSLTIDRVDVHHGGQAIVGNVTNARTE
jgi:hypothetical protein